MTKEELIADIELRVYRGKPSDDVELDKRQISFWLDKHRNMLIKTYVDEFFDIPPSVIKRYDCQTTTEDSPVCISDECFSKYYVELPTKVMQLENDLGVFRVSLQASPSALDRFHLGQSDIFRHTKFAKPTKKNPSWYRINNKIYFIGDSFKKKVMSLDLVPNNTDDYEDTDDYPIPGHLTAALIDLTVKDGLSQISQGINDINNDGKE